MIMLEATIVQDIIRITYSTLLPILVGGVATLIHDLRKSKKSHIEASEKIEKKIDDLTKIVEEEHAMTARYRIIRFDDEALHGMKHSEDHYDQIKEDINTYKRYCDAHPEFINHKGQNAMARILQSDMSLHYNKEGVTYVTYDNN